jgi:sorbitol-6-phosphate 2-dehydrogenase
MRFKEKVVVITGGGGGIGSALCHGFAAEGATVAVADVNLGAAQKVAAEISRSAGKAKAWGFDVSNRLAVEKAADEVETELGPLSVWINNAAISHIVPFLECSEELWDLTLQINLKGTFLGCQVAIRRMLPRRQGVILNMSSQSGKVGNSQYAAYCASKFGIIGLTQSLAVEFAGEGIRLNALCPGVVMTPLWDKMVGDYARKRNLKPEEVPRYLESKVPMGRLCTPEDVTRAAIFLASDEAAYITGQALNLSGGTIMH